MSAAAEMNERSDDRAYFEFRDGLRSPAKRWESQVRTNAAARHAARRRHWKRRNLARRHRGNKPTNKIVGERTSRSGRGSRPRPRSRRRRRGTAPSRSPAAATCAGCAWQRESARHAAHHTHPRRISAGGENERGQASKREEGGNAQARSRGIGSLADEGAARCDAAAARKRYSEQQEAGVTSTCAHLEAAAGKGHVFGTVGNPLQRPVKRESLTKEQGRVQECAKNEHSRAKAQQTRTPSKPGCSSTRSAANAQRGDEETHGSGKEAQHSIVPIMVSTHAKLSLHACNARNPAATTRTQGGQHSAEAIEAEATGDATPQSNGG